MRLISWLIRGFLFFTLFAFALNNQHATTVYFFFGTQWSTPLVIVVLVAFGIGCAIGVLAMLPGWWKHRRTTRQARAAPANSSSDHAAAELATPVSSPRQAS
jgi:uncharacterized integral membrane protein